MVWLLLLSKSPANVPVFLELSGFNFTQSDVNEVLVKSLYRCEFTQGSQNIVFVGRPGTGNLHLATAIGVQAIQQHQLRVRFLSTVELVNVLEQEKMDGKAGRIANRLISAYLVNLDELGHLPFTIYHLPNMAENYCSIY